MLKPLSGKPPTLVDRVAGSGWLSVLNLKRPSVDLAFVIVLSGEGERLPDDKDRLWLLGRGIMVEGERRLWREEWYVWKAIRLGLFKSATSSKNSKETKINILGHDG